ncbi:MAG: hypothetical protein U0414_13185 [Polyangiaceae bacterium]
MALVRRVLGLALPLTALLAGCGGAPGAPSDANKHVDYRGGGDTEGVPQPQPRSPSASDSIAGATPTPSTNESVVRPDTRPGLGTSWGETKSSHLTSAPFSRADFQSPFAMASLFYNNEDGAHAMANSTGFSQSSEGRVDIGNGIATLRLRDADTGRFLSGFHGNNKDFVVGREGQRYAIVVTSNVDSRIEVVLSVDGDDVVDGKPASFSKRGYILDPLGEIEIEGFRQSAEAVAQFTFGSVSDSYAALKHGEAAAKNVGVIGVALFNEAGTNPSLWTRGEVGRRMDANPFPGQFATPPPSR